jgi:hypothetical protein
VVKYVYQGDEELVFPTLGVTVKKGSTFEGPDDITTSGIIIEGKASKTEKVSDSAPAETIESGE